MQRRRTLILAILGLVLLALALGLQSVSALSGVPDNTAVASSVVSLSSIKDNTMYEESNLLSNGSGDYFFAGSIIEDGDRRRALVKFDIAGSIPSSAIILSATLRLHVSKHPDSPLAPSPVPFSLHRVLADWGEGTSDALEPGGSGATATEGDATWLYSHYSLTPTQRITWTTPGGDFVPDASASTLVGLQDNYYVWGLSASLTADVRYWLNFPDDNHGWLLVGDESQDQTARRFDSRENNDLSKRPILFVDYLAVNSQSFLPIVIGN